MLSRRRFSILIAASLGSLVGCTSRTKLPPMTGDPSQDVATLKEQGVNRVTTGIVSLTAFVFFMESFDEEKLLGANQAELLEHVRLIRRNVETLLAAEFKIVRSVAYEDQLLQPDIDGTAIVNWQRMSSNLEEIKKTRNKQVFERIETILREIFGDDYKFVTRT